MLLRGLSLVAVSWGYSLIAVHRLLIAVASLAQALGAQASAVATLGLSSCDLLALGLEGFSSCGTEDH